MLIFSIQTSLGSSIWFLTVLLLFIHQSQGKGVVDSDQGDTSIN